MARHREYEFLIGNYAAKTSESKKGGGGDVYSQRQATKLLGRETELPMSLHREGKKREMSWDKTRGSLDVGEESNREWRRSSQKHIGSRSRLAAAVDRKQTLAGRK